jgi:hypothetical protein
MLGWLWRVIVGRFNGCTHKWKLISETGVVPYEGALPYYRKYVLQCEHCGNLKNKKSA